MNESEVQREMDRIQRVVDRLIDPATFKRMIDALRAVQEARGEPGRMVPVEPEWDAQEHVGLPAILDAIRELKGAEQKGEKKGRRCGDQKTGPTLVLEALATYHGLQEDGFVTVEEPATLEQLKELSGVSRQTCSNFLADKLGKPGYRLYTAKCAQRKIGSLLTIWLGEVPKQMADLLAAEYGRRREDD